MRITAGGVTRVEESRGDVSAVRRDVPVLRERAGGSNGLLLPALLVVVSAAEAARGARASLCRVWRARVQQRISTGDRAGRLLLSCVQARGAGLGRYRQALCSVRQGDAPESKPGPS